MAPTRTSTRLRGSYSTARQAAAVVQEAELRGQYTWSSSALVPARDSKNALRTIKSIEEDIKILTRPLREEFRTWTKQYQASSLSGRAEKAISAIHTRRLKSTLPSKSEQSAHKSALSKTSHQRKYEHSPYSGSTSRVSMVLSAPPMNQIPSLLPSNLKVIEACFDTCHSSSRVCINTFAPIDQKLPTGSPQALRYTSTPFSPNLNPDVRSQGAFESKCVPSTVPTLETENDWWSSYNIWNNIPEYARPEYVSPYPDLGMDDI